MKKLLILTCTLVFFAIPEVHAQIIIDEGSESPLQSQERGTNMISCSAYDAITYNGHTVSELDNTDGNTSVINQLLGSPSSVNNDNAIINEVTYYYGENMLSFRESILRRMEIKQSNWPLTVTEKTVNVGDSFSQMKQEFGDDLKIIYKPMIDDNYSVSFNCYGNDGDGLLIDFNPSTKKVVEIIFFVNP